MTLAHPAAVLPLRRVGLPMSGLVAGSMVPDIPVFLEWHRGYDLTHSLLGILDIDVGLAFCVLLVWFTFARDPVVDMAPEQVRSRLAGRARLTRRQWLLVAPAASVGAATHFLWDSFTHPGRWGPDHIEWLRAEHAGLEGLRWSQYASGVIGLAIVIMASRAYLRSLALLSPRGPSVLPRVTLPAVVMISVVVGVISVIVAVPKGFHVMAFYGVVNSVLALLALGVVACAAWHRAHRRISDDGTRPRSSGPAAAR
jgi:hypothetical protein